MTDLILLVSLLDGPKHGYALKTRIGFLTGQNAIHNNLVYPLLKRFVQKGWVSRRSAAGERGQTRAVYSLSKAGKQVLLERLAILSEKDASSADAVRIRIGLFGILEPAQRQAILQTRDKWLKSSEERLDLIERRQPLDLWATQVVRFLRQQTALERKWLDHLQKLARKPAK